MGISTPHHAPPQQAPDMQQLLASLRLLGVGIEHSSGAADGAPDSAGSSTREKDVASSSGKGPIKLEDVSSNVPADAEQLLATLPTVYDLITKYVLLFPETYTEVWRSLHGVISHIRSHISKHISLKVPAPMTSNFGPKPSAEPRPHATVNCHGEETVDDFRWLHDRENPEVLEYIAKENEYTDKCLAPITPLRNLLYKEFISRIDENEQSAHVTLRDDWTYFSRRVAGQEYRQHCRCRESTGEEQVYLDENEVAAMAEFSDASFFRVGFLRHSPDGQCIAFGVDDTGSERYKVYFKDLNKQQLLPDRITDVWEDFEFSKDGKWAFYLALDDCERAYKVMRHCVGVRDTSHDAVLYEEPDEMFFLTLTKSCNSRYIFFNSAAQVTSETHFIDLEEEHEAEVWVPGEAAGEMRCTQVRGQGLAPPRPVFVRRENVQYTVETHGDYFYILTNEGAKNNWLFRIRISCVPAGDLCGNPATASEHQEAVIPPRDFVLIEDFQIRARHLVVFERSNCMQNVRIVDLTDTTLETYHYISFSELVYSLWPMTVSEEIADLSKQTLFDTSVLRYTYTSFIQPKQIIDYNMDDRTFVVVHTESVSGPIPYNPDLYTSRRLFATGTDGTAVPISLVFRKDLLGFGDGQPNPLLLHAYGAYGSCVNPIFSTQRLSLLDRGFIYAAAHVRGGADMGMGWYEEGKLAKKPNTFQDFISCMEYLIKACREGYTSPEKLAIYGRSAGGLLMGAVINSVPHLFRSALTEVPFIDVINTMFDSSIPWTAFEYEEWGNPEDKNIYELMKTYCPYTNIASQEYPHIMVCGGMNDPRVAFFEPLKFVAKLRQHNTSDNLLLLRVDDAGHGGNSGQYSHLEDLAQEYGYLIYTLNASFKPIPHASTLQSLPRYSLDPEELYAYISTPASRYRPAISSANANDARYGEYEDDVSVDTNLSTSDAVRRRNMRESHLTADDDWAREYRTAGRKGGRGMNKVYQWLATFF
ncbi:hypothetical protein RI367_005286 [Sorochytrium milnesiophthora]